MWLGWIGGGDRGIEIPLPLFRGCSVGRRGIGVGDIWEFW